MRHEPGYLLANPLQDLTLPTATEPYRWHAEQVDGALLTAVLAVDR